MVGDVGQNPVKRFGGPATGTARWRVVHDRAGGFKHLEPTLDASDGWAEQIGDVVDVPGVHVDQRHRAPPEVLVPNHANANRIVQCKQVQC